MRLASAIPHIIVFVLLGALDTVLAQSGTAPALRVEVPVVLKEAKVVFNMDHLDFEGTTPTALAWMKRNVASFMRDKTSWQVIAVSHGPGGFLMLNDASYDRVRKSTGGNPYKPFIAELQRTGIRFEECGETMHLNGWTNADLLPGVQVTTSAILRFIQLGQEGFVQIHP
jgi:intracellular sulfur oxidation DsrE/DsrF family protein